MSRLVLRVALVAAGAALGVSVAADAARAAPTVTITSLRVVDASGSPAKGPLRRSRQYSYRVEYTIGGDDVVRVTRAATVENPNEVVAIVRPAAAFADPGRYRVTGRLRVGADDPPGQYSIVYTVAVRDRDGGPVVKRRSRIAVVFR